MSAKREWLDGLPGYGDEMPEEYGADDEEEDDGDI